MLRPRVIVCLDVKDGRVVKGTQFKNLRDVGVPVALAERYAVADARGAFVQLLIGLRLKLHLGTDTLDDVARLDEDPVRCLDPDTAAAMIASGLAGYGRWPEAHRIVQSLLGAARHFDYQLPEVFAGSAIYPADERASDLVVGAPLYQKAQHLQFPRRGGVDLFEERQHVGAGVPLRRVVGCGGGVFAVPVPAVPVRVAVGPDHQHRQTEAEAVRKEIAALCYPHQAARFTRVHPPPQERGRDCAAFGAN